MYDIRASFLRGALPLLGLPQNFTELTEAEQLSRLTASAKKLKHPQLLVFVAQLDPLLRSRARQGMAAYIHYMGLGFRPALHHRLLIEGLEGITRSEIDRLMVFMPPGSAKSTYTSVVFPSWYLGRNPANSMIAASHTEELTSRFGRRARNLYASERHRNVFGLGVAKDSGAAGRWDTARGGEYYAVGFNGSVTGRRADVLVIDDPIRGREDADSQRIRDKTWDVYINDLLTRLKPGGRQVLVSTRWHEDDLAGRILEMEGPRWQVIRLPMEAGSNDALGRKPGERLWPEWFTQEMVSDAKRDARAWNALYQQEPAGEDGDYFHRDWFRDFELAPGQLRVYAASDYAVTERGGDWTEHGIFGIDANRNLYVLDWWSGQESADRWIEVQCDMIQKWKPVCWFGEAGPIRRAIEPFLLRRMDDRGAYCRLEWLPSIHDKPTRSRAFQALTANGKVFLPKRGAEWRSDVIGQLLRFPVGQHDDKVDVCSLIGRGLEYVNAPEMDSNIINLPTRYNVGYASAKRRWGAMRRGAVRTMGAALLLAVLPSLGQAQSVPAYQMGTVLPNDLTKFQRDGQIRNSGGIAGDNNGIGVNPFGITDYGQPGVCSNSKATTGPYSQVCLGHDTAGNPVLSAGGVGGEPARPLVGWINGQRYEFPFVLPGTGVIGPMPTVIGHLATWGNTTGTLLQDSTTLTLNNDPMISNQRSIVNDMGNHIGMFQYYPGLQMDISSGTTAVPVNKPGATLRVARLEEYTTISTAGCGIPGQGGNINTDCNAAIYGVSDAAANSIQVNFGVVGAANVRQETGHPLGSEVQADGAGVYGIARALGNTPNKAFAGAFYARADSPVGWAVGMEITIANATGHDVTENVIDSYGHNGIQIDCGIGTFPSHNCNNAIFTTYVGNQFLNGIVIGPESIINKSFYDVSDSYASIAVRGSHYYQFDGEDFAVTGQHGTAGKTGVFIGPAPSEPSSLNRRFAVWSADNNQGYFASVGATPATVAIDTPAGGQVGQLTFMDTTNPLWSIGKRADNEFFIMYNPTSSLLMSTKFGELVLGKLQGVTIANDAQRITVNDQGGGAATEIRFADTGTALWSVGKDSSNEFFMLYGPTSSLYMHTSPADGGSFMLGKAQNFKINGFGEVIVGQLAGTGNRLACIDSTGKLYSGTATAC